jgi:uroporphyrinogen III methyltransferase / synthase
VPSLKALVTRPAEQAPALVAELEAQGFEAVVVPLVAIEPLSDDPIDVSGYEWVVVTSANGARELARRVSGAPAHVAAVGPGTAAALEQAGLAPDLVAEVHTQEGLVAALGAPAGRVLFVAAEGARSFLPEALGADVLLAYRTVQLEVASLPAVDVALLASASAARAYARAGGRGPAISIGPQTTVAARDVGVEVVAEAGSHDVRGLVDCAAAWRASLRS